MTVEDPTNLKRVMYQDCSQDSLASGLWAMLSLHVQTFSGHCLEKDIYLAAYVAPKPVYIYIDISVNIDDSFMDV